MYKYFLPFLLLFVGSCENDDNRISSIAVTQQNNTLTIIIDGVTEKSSVLLVNGKNYDNFRLSGSTTIDEPYLLPGINLVQLIIPAGTGKADTLSDSAFFSYEIGYTLVKEYKHDIERFTQGLFIEDDILYESTGLEGKSGIWKYKIGDHELTEYQSVHNNDEIFGEGIAAVKNSLFQLSWENKVVFEYDKNTLKKKKEFPYPYEGWGLTADGDSLIASDGSEILYFINPADFSIYNKVPVRGSSGLVKNINELEFVGSVIVANVWQSNTVIFIDKKSGYVLASVDLTALSQSARQENPKADVLNGIAYDPANNTFLVTGKLWPKVYRIKLDDRFEKIRQ